MNKNLIIKNQIELFVKAAESNKYIFTKKQIDQFSKYLSKLIEWNKRINLVSKNDESRVAEKHFFVSMAILDVITIPKGSYVVDVGSGAGFPGLPIKIVRPDINLTLVDSKRMKTLFLLDVVKSLDVQGFKIVNERAEIACLKPEFHKKFDYVVCRAVSNLVNIFQWTKPFLKPGANILALKGGNFEQEIESLKKEIGVVKYKLLPMKSLLLSELNDLVIIQITI